MLYGVVVLEWKSTEESKQEPCARFYYRGSHEKENEFLNRVLRSRWIGALQAPIPIVGEMKSRLRKGLVAHLAFPEEKRYLELVPLQCERRRWKEGQRVVDFVFDETGWKSLLPKNKWDRMRL